MRSDYAMYVVAVICFIIAGAFLAATAAPLQLAGGGIFFIIGIVLAAAGYIMRPRVVVSQPSVPSPPPMEPQPTMAEPVPMGQEEVEENVEMPAEQRPKDEIEAAMRPQIESPPVESEEEESTVPAPSPLAPEPEPEPEPEPMPGPAAPAPQTPIVEIAAEEKPRARYGGDRMAKCPTCGTEVSSPKKKWTMAGRPDKTGKRMQLEIGLFDCPKCHKPFRVVLNRKKI